MSVDSRHCTKSARTIQAALQKGHSRSKTRRVTNWRHGHMAVRWAAASLLETERRFKKLMGYQHLGFLERCLNESKFETK